MGQAKHIAIAVKASDTTLTKDLGLGPCVAATMNGEVGDIGSFKNREHFAAYNGTASLEAFSGTRKIYRLSRKGNLRLIHAIHMAAMTPVGMPTAPVGLKIMDSCPRRKLVSAASWRVR
jgi:transposase